MHYEECVKNINIDNEEKELSIAIEQAKQLASIVETLFKQRWEIEKEHDGSERSFNLNWANHEAKLLVKFLLKAKAASVEQTILHLKR